MKHRSAFLVLWVSALMLWSCSEGKRGKSFTVEVPCALTWSRTGVVLTPGQRITLVAEGELRGGEWRFGPEGTNDHPQWTRYSLVPEWPHLALIAKVGEDGDPFLVGRRFSGTVIRGGELYLGINDLDAENNDGSFEVTVTVEENR
ncbi:MAG: hypothetical protein NZ869_05420 [Thermoanaerobaculum sp.]|nr:hypothetical protein [Thermoanaerobaculum sp.]MDW7967598.1 hypothetical protein [Thermoanaerobaculum sp.]